MDKLVLVGAGGHARSVMDIALQNADYEIIGCIDRAAGEVLGKPVVGKDEDLDDFLVQGIRHIFVAIGDNSLRDRLYDRAISIGFEAVNIISRYAVISPRAQLGKGICIMPGAVINVNTVVEDNCIINTRCSIDHDSHIGKSSHIAPGVTLSGTVNIGNGVHVGTGASLIDKVSIGDWSYIGGGAVVVNDLPSGVMAYGVPAKVIRKLIP
jgi:UDP-perosamine 4-acetyltransferase